MPVRTLLAWGTEQLERIGAPEIEARWLLEWALGESSLALAGPDAGIRSAEKYRSAIAQRRSRIPLQHITGRMAFRYLSLKAGRGVFTVRPETEMLVDLALEALAPGPAEVVDLCAGSGAVGLALASERPNTHVVAVELDEAASKYLFANVRETQPLAPSSTITVRVEDATRALPHKSDSFDLVVSNPPYVGAFDAPIQAEAKADPPIALYGGGEDGLVTPRGIVNRAHGLLRSGGTLIMEHGEKQGLPLRQHAENLGFVDCRTVNDLAGRPRFLQARKS